MIDSLSSIGTWWLFALAAGTPILVLSLVARWSIKNPAKRIGIAWVTTIGLIALTIWISWPDRPVILPLLRTTEAPVLTSPPIWAPALRQDNRWRLPATPSTPVSTSELVDPTITNMQSSTAPTKLSWQVVAGVVFVFYAASYSAFCFLGFARLKSIVWQADSAEETFTRLFAKLFPQLSNRVRVMLTNAVATPAVTGALRPIILLPKSIVDEQRAVLLAALRHEGTHIEHRDLLLRTFERWARFVFGLHPLYMLHERLSHLDQELVADAAAANENPILYAELLLQWTRRRLPAPRFAGAIPWVTDSDWNLQRRIQMLLNGSPISMQPISTRWKFSTLIVGSVFLLLCGGVGFTSPLPTSEQTQVLKDSDFDAKSNPTSIRNVVGVCNDDNGKPIANAKAELWIIRRHEGRQSKAHMERETTTSDKGEFRFGDVAVPLRFGELQRIVIVRANNYGNCSKGLESLQATTDESKELSIAMELHRIDAEFAGRVIDPEGKPLPNLRICGNPNEDPAMQLGGIQN